ncbi:hypothetical protein [Streptomyces sp. MNU76]|uniref:hypothetical protein n=1 Tax=Streptomyces sp. MNU76 TaxID=2560026 RepID=UPI0035A8D4F7
MPSLRCRIHSWDLSTGVDGPGTRFVAREGDATVFHKLGAAKYEAFGLPFPLRDTPRPDADLTERVRERFRTHGVRAY